MFIIIIISIIIIIRNEEKTEVLVVTAKRVVNLQHLPEFMNVNGTCVKFSSSM